MPAVRPVAVPVTLVITPEAGVPRMGPVIVGDVSVLPVSVWVPPTVTTLAVLVPAVVTRRSPVPTVRIPVVCVATQSVLAKCSVPPEARKRSAHPSEEVPRAATSLVVGLAEPDVSRSDVRPITVPPVIAAADAPRVVRPEMVPPVIATAEGSCVAIVPVNPATTLVPSQ